MQVATLPHDSWADGTSSYKLVIALGTSKVLSRLPECAESVK